MIDILCKKTIKADQKDLPLIYDEHQPPTIQYFS